MYSAFPSSHRALAKEIMDEIGTIEKVLRSASHRSDNSLPAYYNNLLQSNKTCINHCSMEEAIKAVKHCDQLAEAQQVISIIHSI